MRADVPAFLPEILIRRVEEVPPSFHARFSCRAKTYDYLIHNHPDPLPFFRRYLWTVPEPLDWEAVRFGLARLIGRRDFSSFQSQGSPVAHGIRTLYQASLITTPWGWFRLRFKADGFLRHMVRNMVGLLVRVGSGRVNVEELPGIIEARDRRLAGEMAPAHGLYLRKVFY